MAPSGAAWAAFAENSAVGRSPFAGSFPGSDDLVPSMGSQFA